MAGVSGIILSGRDGESSLKVIHEFFQERGVTFSTTTNNEVKFTVLERLKRAINERLSVYISNTAEFISVH